MTNFFLTGCASGMGRRLTDVFQKRGDRVYATDVNFEALKATAEELNWPEDRVQLSALNVTDYEQFEQTFAQAVDAFGGIDVAMNIAGLLLASWAHETPAKEIHSQVDVNIKGVMFGTRIAAAHMVERGGGHVVNLASMAGLAPIPGLAVYSGTKYAVRSYSVTAALELRSKGVYVTAVCPASVQTPMLDNQLQNDAAAMFYSGAKILTLDDIEHAIVHKALRKKPYEIHLPKSKALLARFVDLFPWSGPMFLPLYHWSGRRRMQQRRTSGSSQG